MSAVFNIPILANSSHSFDNIPITPQLEPGFPEAPTSQKQTICYLNDGWPIDVKDVMASIMPLVCACFSAGSSFTAI